MRSLAQASTGVFQPCGGDRSENAIGSFRQTKLGSVGAKMITMVVVSNIFCHPYLGK